MKLSTKLATIFRDRVIAKLSEYGWTQTDLANQLGVTPSYVSQVMTGHRGIGLDTLENFAEALEVEPAYLITEKKNAFAG